MADSEKKGGIPHCDDVTQRCGGHLLQLVILKFMRRELRLVTSQTFAGNNGFMSGRADKAQRRMATLRIGERFDVKENAGACLRPSFKDYVMHQFRFQIAIETLGWCIIVPNTCTIDVHLKLIVL